MTCGLNTRRRNMNALFRPNEFLKLTFTADELLIGYNILLNLHAKTPSKDLATMIKAMEDKLFPKPKLILISHFHLCVKCFCELDIRKDAYHVRTSNTGSIEWSHQFCPILKEARPE
jgi:hypothetical protein